MGTIPQPQQRPQPQKRKAPQQKPMAQQNVKPQQPKQRVDMQPRKQVPPPPQKMQQSYEGEGERRKKGGVGTIIVILLIACLGMAGCFFYITQIKDKGNIASTNTLNQTGPVIDQTETVAAVYDYEPKYNLDTNTLSLNLVNLYNADSGITIQAVIRETNGEMLYTSDFLSPEQILANITLMLPDASFPKTVNLSLIAYDTTGNVMKTQEASLNIIN